jgi:hypothetical protein
VVAVVVAVTVAVRAVMAMPLINQLVYVLRAEAEAQVP